MDSTLREQMISEHVHLVHCIVGRVTTSLPPTVDREDLLSAGTVGLIKAVDRYDPKRGVKFETYASQVIRGEVMESLRDRDWAPRGLRRRARELAAAVAGKQRELGRPPEDEEIAEAMGLTLKQYHELLSEASGTSLLSLDEVFEMGVQAEGDTSRELMPAEAEESPLDKLTQDEQRAEIAHAVNELPDREKLVVSLYYQDGLSLREIGEVLGVTESRICQIHTQAITRLRAVLVQDL